MKKEIGSNFWINPSELIQETKQITLSSFGLSDSEYVWLSSGRKAIELILRSSAIDVTDRKVALVPSFTCWSVLEPFIKTEYKLYGYDVDESLTTTADDLMETLTKVKPSVFLFHRYFGFNTIQEIDQVIDFAREQGVITIEDCTQTLYSKEKSNADFHIASIRKWCGVPDGAFLSYRSNKIQIERPQETIYDTTLESLKVQASLLKNNYIECGEGNKSDFLELYRQAEERLSSQQCFFSITPTSLKIQSNLDILELIRRRRSNYTTLLEGLKNITSVVPLFLMLAEGVTPLYLPVLCIKEREAVQKTLANHNIFAPIVWPKAQNAPTTSKAVDLLYSNLLCIPIDQRYSTAEMEHIISILERL